MLTSKGIIGIQYISAPMECQCSSWKVEKIVAALVS